MTTKLGQQCLLGVGVGADQRVLHLVRSGDALVMGLTLHPSTLGGDMFEYMVCKDMCDDQMGWAQADVAMLEYQGFSFSYT